MPAKYFFTIEEISEIYNIKKKFITELAQFGIIDIYKKKKTECILLHDIESLKTARRLYFDLGVNKEGIEIILSMRQQILKLQQEVNELKRKNNYLKNEQNYRNLEIIIKKGLLFDV